MQASNWNGTCESEKEGTLVSYCEAFNYLFERYATNYIIAETDDNMMRFPHMSNNLPTEYAEVLENRAARCDREYGEYVFKCILKEEFR